MSNVHLFGADVVISSFQVLVLGSFTKKNTINFIHIKGCSSRIKSSFCKIQNIKVKVCLNNTEEELNINHVSNRRISLESYSYHRIDFIITKSYSK